MRSFPPANGPLFNGYWDYFGVDAGIKFHLLVNNVVPVPEHSIVSVDLGEFRRYEGSVSQSEYQRVFGEGK